MFGRSLLIFKESLQCTSTRVGTNPLVDEQECSLIVFHCYLGELSMVVSGSPKRWDW